MDDDGQPLVFPHNLIKMGKDLFESFKRKPVLTILAGAAIVGAVFHLLLTHLLGTCLVSIIPPFLMLALFWTFEIKRGKMLLLAGVVGCTAIMVVGTVFYVGVYSEVEPMSMYSDDADRTLRDGMVDPLRGDAQQVFNYTLNVYTEPYIGMDTPIENVSVLIYTLGGLSNYTMSAGDRNDSVARYYYTTTLESAINQFVFVAKVNGTWLMASEYLDDKNALALGPISSDQWELTKPILYYSAIQAYVQFFAIYAILVGMIWWTRRARRMREEALDKWEKKRKDEAAKAPKEEKKVPSMRKAMGLEEEEGESFVCSECGADVPADAKECPSCGEKFE